MENETIAKVAATLQVRRANRQSGIGLPECLAQLARHLALAAVALGGDLLGLGL